MNAFQTYRMYLALKQHFTSKSYDFFKYNGSVKVSEQSFQKRKDQNQFLRISRHRDPKKYLIGNFIYNDSTWIGYFNDECYLEFERYLDNGIYHFKNDLNKLKNEFKDNFRVDSDNTIPYIMELKNRGDITFFTLCILDRFFDYSSKYEKDYFLESILLFEDDLQKIKKSKYFFNIDINKYKPLVLERFNRS